MKRADVIDRSRIAPGNIIVGLTSFGKSTYEDEYNSGIGSNGLTLARHGLFGSYLGEKYPELYDHKNLSKDKVFFGSGRLDQIPEGEELPLGKLVLSPTRTYAPVMLSFFQKVDRSKLTGIIHCSGGGQLKCKEKISNVHIVKNNLFPPPFIFKALYATGKMDEREMYMDLNMGSRMEVYCADEETAQLLIATAKEFNVEARKIGYCEKFEDKNLTKKVTITSWLGNTITYAW
jgi:phosphoribosylformylglycinamidine cyclo-ligase